MNLHFNWVVVPIENICKSCKKQKLEKTAGGFYFCAYCGLMFIPSVIEIKETNGSKKPSK